MILANKEGKSQCQTGKIYGVSPQLGSPDKSVPRKQSRPKDQQPPQPPETVWHPNQQRVTIGAGRL